MGISDEITKRLITGETENELINNGFNKALVHREWNKIKLIKELTQTVKTTSQDNLDIKKLLIYAHHNTIEIAWGTLIGMFGLVAAFKAISQDGTVWVLLFAGPIYFMISLANLRRSINRLDPPKTKTPWLIILGLAFLAPVSLLFLFNGVGALLGLQFLELLKPLIIYPVNSVIWPGITVILGLLLLGMYLGLFAKYTKAEASNLDKNVKGDVSGNGISPK